jgi:uncharacterized membrane protein YraQ (UPF0718 family)
LGVARALGAIIFSIIIGLLMHLFFMKEESEKAKMQAAMPEPKAQRALWKNVVYFAAMIGILVFANWGHSPDTGGLWQTVSSVKWFITGAVAIILAIILIAWFELKIWPVIGVTVMTIALSIIIPSQPMIPFAAAAVGLSVITGSNKGEAGEWFEQSWGFAKQILPLLFAGVLMAGLLLGRPGQEGIIPAEWISRSVGGNSLGANLFASVVGAFMYFATLTEVPILQGLIGNGMGKGPALALLLAGPALSLPNMLVIRSVIGTKKTIVYIVLVVIMATISGLIYGALF